jgi:hypothetical protein
MGNDINRRDFLRLTSLAGLGLGLFGLTSCTSHPDGKYPSGQPMSFKIKDILNKGTKPEPPITKPGDVISRSVWGAQDPDKSKFWAMDGVQRITVHHSGLEDPFFATDFDSDAAMVRTIQRSHMNGRDFGDIGYHFVIDPAGRIWQGREMKWQGAHTHDNNPHNIGVVCLGNFDKQNPTEKQKATLKSWLIQLKTTYKVPTRSIYTHQELSPSSCPGKNLQKYMVSLRKNLD